MTDFKFNHDADDHAESLGIAKERVDKFHEVTKEIALRAAVTDMDMNSDSAAFQELLNTLNPVDVVEAILIGRLYTGYFQRLKKQAESVLKTLRIE